MLTGTYDFFGLNFYTAYVGLNGDEGETPSRERDMGTKVLQDPNWPVSASSWLRVRTFAYNCVHPHIYLFISSPWSLLFLDTYDRVKLKFSLAYVYCKLIF